MIKWKEFNSCVKFGKARLFGFRGAKLKQLPSHIDVNLENSNFNTVIMHVEIKGALSGLRRFLATESPLKMMKNAFCFSVKALFFLKIFKFLF